MDEPLSGQQFTIAAGGHEVVAVEVGAGLRTYTFEGEPVLAGYPVSEMAWDGRGQLLAPWPNRVRDGRYEFAGETLQLPLSEPAKHNAIHGLVRWDGWSVVEQNDAGIVLGHRLQASPGYPFTLDLTVEYRVDAVDGLTVHTAATNVGQRAGPYGVGAHPYVTVGDETVDETVFSSPAGTRLRLDEHAIPVGREPVEGTPYDFRVPRPVGSLAFDDAFTDLDRDADGRAWVELARADGSRRVRVWLGAGFDHLMVFSGDPLPAGRRRRSLAIEPMTCAPDAFNSLEGLRTLQPGQSFAASWGIRV
jgi:aldose 1-epimerase